MPTISTVPFQSPSLPTISHFPVTVTGSGAPLVVVLAVLAAGLVAAAGDEVAVVEFVFEVLAPQAAITTPSEKIIRPKPAFRIIVFSLRICSFGKQPAHYTTRRGFTSTLFQPEGFSSQPEGLPESSRWSEPAETTGIVRANKLHPGGVREHDVCVVFNPSSSLAPLPGAFLFADLIRWSPKTPTTGYSLATLRIALLNSASTRDTSPHI